MLYWGWVASERPQCACVSLREQAAGKPELGFVLITNLGIKQQTKPTGLMQDSLLISLTSALGNIDTTAITETQTTTDTEQQSQPYTSCRLSDNCRRRHQLAQITLRETACEKMRLHYTGKRRVACTKLHVHKRQFDECVGNDYVPHLIKMT